MTEQNPHFREFTSLFPLRLCAGKGRIELKMLAFRSGGDIEIILNGGRAHLGAIALADAGGAKMLERAGHREGQVALDVAAAIANGLDCAVAVACGIHYDGITPSEIAAVIELAHNLAEELLQRAGGGYADHD